MADQEKNGLLVEGGELSDAISLTGWHLVHAFYSITQTDNNVKGKL